MPRKTADARVPWRYHGRAVGFVRCGVYYIDRTFGGRRVKISTGCISLAAANTEYERFELTPAAYVNRLGRRAFVGRPPRALAAAADPARAAAQRDGHLDRAYRTTPAEIDALRIVQGDRCAICGRSAAEARGGVLEVDHDHATGAVRGLLCGPCNRGIGQLGDSPTVLRAAASYLECAAHAAHSIAGTA